MKGFQGWIDALQKYSCMPTAVKKSLQEAVSCFHTKALLKYATN